VPEPFSQRSAVDHCRTGGLDNLLHQVNFTFTAGL
jgi:hypothetical protein